MQYDLRQRQMDMVRQRQLNTSMDISQQANACIHINGNEVMNITSNSSTLLSSKNSRKAGLMSTDSVTRKSLPLKVPMRDLW